MVNDIEITFKEKEKELEECSLDLDTGHSVPVQMLMKSAAKKMHEEADVPDALVIDPKERIRGFVSKPIPTGRGRRVFGVNSDGCVSESPVEIDEKGQESDNKFNPIIEDVREDTRNGTAPACYTDDRHKSNIKKEFCRFVIDPSGLYGQYRGKGNGIMKEPWEKVKPFSLEDTEQAIKLLSHISLDEVKLWWTHSDFTDVVKNDSLISTISSNVPLEKTSMVGLDVSMTGYGQAGSMLKSAMGRPDFSRRLAKTIEIVLDLHSKISKELQDIKVPLSIRTGRFIKYLFNGFRNHVGRFLAKVGKYIYVLGLKTVVKHNNDPNIHREYIKSDNSKD